MTSMPVTAAGRVKGIRAVAKRRRGSIRVIIRDARKGLTLDGQLQAGFGLEREVGELTAGEFWESGLGDHDGVVGGVTRLGEVDGEGELATGGFRAQACIASDAASDDHGAGVDGRSGADGAAEQVVDDRLLKAGEEVERLLGRDGEPFVDRGVGRVQAESAALLDFGGEVAGLGPIEDGGFPAGEAVVLGIAFGAGRGEVAGEGEGVAVGGELIDDGSAGVGEAEELGDLVIGFTGGIVAGAAEEAIVPAFVHFEQMRMAAADDQREHGEGGLGIHDGGVDVAFQMIDGDEGKPVGEGESLGVGDADQERADETGTFGDGDGIKIFEISARAFERGADGGHNGAEVFAGGEFRHDAAIGAMRGELGGDGGGENLSASGDDGGGRFIAGAFDTEDPLQIAILAACSSQTLTLYCRRS